MRKLLVTGLSIVFVMMCMSAKSQTMTDKEKISYALGANVAESFKSNKIDVELAKFQEGFGDVMKGSNKFSEEEMQAAFALLEKMMNQGADDEKARGAEFLAKNKMNAGVIETPSGLQYKVVTMGTGPKPTATDKVKVHYHGTTIDGVVFDSSVQRGEPISFGLNQVIRGWTEGVQLMPVGSKFIFYIPSDLAYGDRGAGGAIKPGAALIFEVELFEINPAE